MEYFAVIFVNYFVAVKVKNPPIKHKGKLK